MENTTDLPDSIDALDALEGWKVWNAHLIEPDQLGRLEAIIARLRSEK